MLARGSIKGASMRRGRQPLPAADPVRRTSTGSAGSGQYKYTGVQMKGLGDYMA